MIEVDAGDAVAVVDRMFAVIRNGSFDDGRAQMLGLLATDLRVTENDVAELLQVFAFDQDRVGCVRVMAPHLDGTPTLAGARAVLQAFSFDDDRVAAAGLLATRWLDLPQADRLALVGAFTFDSGKQQATRLLTR